MNRTEILGLIRHVLTTVGGGYVTKGAIDADALDALVGGAVVAIGIVWSVIEKRQRKTDTTVTIQK